MIGEPLTGPGVDSAARALQSVERVYGGLEIIDSRFTDFRFTLPDVIADNASSSPLIVGCGGYDPLGLELALEASTISEIDPLRAP